MTATDVVHLKQQLALRTGLCMDLLDQPGLAGFVQRRLAGLGLDHESTYYRLVLRDADEMERLVQEVSVAETWFFRYPTSFRLLSEHCSSLLQRRDGKLRLLSIACATGEEPYGMAMAAVHAGWPLQRVVIDAVDRNEASLQTAREACYGNRSFREPIPDWAQRWFRRTDRGTRVHDDIVATVRFRRQDILGRTWLQGHATYDAIFCRNLLIYLREDSRKALGELLSSSLASDGILFVGHAEQATLPPSSFEPVNARQTFALHRRQQRLADQDSVVSLPKPPSKSPAPRLRTSEVASVQEPVVARRTDSHSNIRRQRTLADARALADAGRLEEALAALTVMQSPRSPSPEFFDLMGNIQLGLGRLDLAREAFHKVLYLAPNHVHALMQMAIICDRSGSEEQAARFRRRAARAHNEDTKQSTQESYE